MDELTLRVFAVLFVLATVVLLYTARYFQGRRGRRRAQRQLAAVERLPEWTVASIDTNRPLHLSLGGATVGGDTTPAALAGAEFFIT